MAPRNFLLLILICCSFTCCIHGQQQQQWNGKKFAISLSYDDALDVHLDHALPVLDSLDIKATFYVPAHSGNLMERREEWIKVARNGHELGNHTLFHPCSSNGGEREWVSSQYDLDQYNVDRILDEIQLANNILFAIDGKTERSFAYTCGDTEAGNESFVEELKDDFISARGIENKNNQLNQTDLFQLTTFSVNGQTITELIAAVEKARTEKTYLIFLFHGVGGGHSLDCDKQAHSELLEYIHRIKNEVWIAPVVEVSDYINKHQNQ